MRSLSQAGLQLSPTDLVLLEHAFAVSLFARCQKNSENLDGNGNGNSSDPSESEADKAVRVQQEKNQRRNKKLLRYAKIGAASLGAGAILAVTGGLAAPALAGALVLMGTTTIAATVSLSTMAAVFGSVGGGE
jgi:hypothetical protein